MILIPVKSDQKTIAKGFRKADMFVFLDPQSGIVIQENHFKTDKSAVFFEHFEKYDVEALYAKDLGYKTYLKLDKLGIKISIIKNATLYTHIDPNELVELNENNAQVYCTMGHHKKESL
jgi:predicted Fe-Mo cluster-binding NifX family protein